MPVRKFRSIEEMSERWRAPGAPELMEAIRAVWELGRRTVDRRFPPGVYKHATIEDAQDQRQAWEDENVRRHRDRDSTRHM